MKHCNKCCKKPKCDHICCDQKHKNKCIKIKKTFGITDFDHPPTNPLAIIYAKHKLWVTRNGAGLITKHDLNGTLLATITVPVATGNPDSVGSPTGIVHNTGPNFIITNGPFSAPATLLASTEDGLIVAYNPSVYLTVATTVVDRYNQNSVYTGLAVTSTNIYVADFYNGRIDTFGPTFNGPLSGFPFIDLMVPTDFYPFNIVYLNNNLYILYAKRDGSPDGGFVNIFDTDGNFIQRLVSGGYLASPWALVLAPPPFGLECGALLIGNFGNGTVNGYSKNGVFLGRLRDKNCVDIIIPGLWGLANGSYTKLFFASENNRLGYIAPNT